MVLEATAKCGFLFLEIIVEFSIETWEHSLFVGF
jgi:hypothetical protein